MGEVVHLVHSIPRKCPTTRIPGRFLLNEVVHSNQGNCSLVVHCCSHRLGFQCNAVVKITLVALVNRKAGGASNAGADGVLGFLHFALIQQPAVEGFAKKFCLDGV